MLPLISGKHHYYTNEEYTLILQNGTVLQALYMPIETWGFRQYFTYVMRMFQ